ncbi:MAG: hypothetical protein JJE55_14110 [Flavobacteriaceae bacterium]|nr:hypothetical protein [Flavobacteriaceae bacterium]
MPYDPKIHHRKSIRLKGYDYSQDGLYFVTICCENKVCRFGDIKDGEMCLNEYGEIAYSQWLKLAGRFTNCELDVFQIMPNHMHGIIVLNNPAPANRAVSKNVEKNMAGAPIANGKNDIENIAAAGAPIADAHNDIENTAAGAPVADAHNDIENTAAGAPLAGALIDDDAGADYENGAGADYKNGAGADSIKGAGADSIKGAGASPARTGANAAYLGDIVGAYKSIVANECLRIYKLNNQIMGKLWQRNYYEIIIRNQQSYSRISEYIINNPAKWDSDKFYIYK